MRYIIILLLAILPLASFSQSYEANKLENAIFQIQQNGRQANTTIVTGVDSKFDVKEFELIREDMLEKDEIFKVELIHEEKSIKVYHFTDIDVDGLKHFIIPHKRDVHFEESVSYTL
jgi:hypothetical protein